MRPGDLSARAADRRRIRLNYPRPLLSVPFYPRGSALRGLAKLRDYARQERALGDERFQRMVEVTLAQPARRGLADGRRKDPALRRLNYLRPLLFCHILADYERF